MKGVFGGESESGEGGGAENKGGSEGCAERGHPWDRTQALVTL